MSQAKHAVSQPQNEPVLQYTPGSPERKRIEARLRELKSEQIEIPLIIGGKEVRTGDMGQVLCPHDHSHILAQYHKAGPEQVEQAARAAQKAWPQWANMPWQARASVFLKAADLVSGPFRDTLNAGHHAQPVQNGAPGRD